jgi:hypothetical protein
MEERKTEESEMKEDKAKKEARGLDPERDLQANSSDKPQNQSHEDALPSAVTSGASDATTQARYNTTDTSSAPPMPSLPPNMGEMVADGEGGLVVSTSDADAGSDPQKLAIIAPSRFDGLSRPDSAGQPDQPSPRGMPSATNRGTDVARHFLTGVESPACVARLSDVSTAQVESGSIGNAVPVSSHPNEESRQELSLLPARLLPEIGRLSREIVRNCEEKVALAVGAYNSVRSLYNICGGASADD